MKLRYYREGGSEKHLRDITGMLVAQPKIDTTYIAEWAARFSIDDIWAAVAARAAEENPGWICDG